MSAPPPPAMTLSPALPRITWPNSAPTRTRAVRAPQQRARPPAAGDAIVAGIAADHLAELVADQHQRVARALVGGLHQLHLAAARQAGIGPRHHAAVAAAPPPVPPGGAR